MYGYTYLTYDTKRDMYYVGQHKSETYDPKYLGSGNHIRRILKKRPETLRNYVLEWCETKDTLDESEIRWIEYFREEMGVDKCYNIADGADGGCVWSNNKEAVSKKISSTHKIIDNQPSIREIKSKRQSEVWKRDGYRETVSENIRRKWNETEFRDKMRDIHKTSNNTPEYKAKMAESIRNKWNETEFRDKVLNSLQNPEVKAKMSATHKGRRFVTNGVDNKQVLPDDVNAYLEMGWWLGKTHHKRVA